MFEDSVKLFDLAGNHEKVVELLNKLLAQVANQKVLFLNSALQELPYRILLTQPREVFISQFLPNIWCHFNLAVKFFPLYLCVVSRLFRLGPDLFKKYTFLVYTQQFISTVQKLPTKRCQRPGVDFINCFAPYAQLLRSFLKV